MKEDNSRVAFAVHTNVVAKIKEFRVINPRLAYLIVEAKWIDILFINVYDLNTARNVDFYPEIRPLL